MDTEQAQLLSKALATYLTQFELRSVVVGIGSWLMNYISIRQLKAS